MKLKNLCAVIILNIMMCVQINASDEFKQNLKTSSQVRQGLSLGYLVIGENKFLDVMMNHYAESLTCYQAAEVVLKSEGKVETLLFTSRGHNKIFLIRALDRKNKQTRIKDVVLLARLLNHRKAIEDFEDQGR